MTCARALRPLVPGQAASADAESTALAVPFLLFAGGRAFFAAGGAAVAGVGGTAAFLDFVQGWSVGVVSITAVRTTYDRASTHLGFLLLLRGRSARRGAR